MKNMGDILRQAQVMQQKLSKMQQEMAGKEFEASSGGGMVTARVSGRQELLALVVDPKALEGGDVEMLQDLILAAVNEAMRIAKDSMEREMNALTGGIKLPGMI
jgi:DNA-binding YbaB/EbfC family protein